MLDRVKNVLVSDGGHSKYVVVPDVGQSLRTQSQMLDRVKNVLVPDGGQSLKTYSARSWIKSKSG